MMNETWIRRLRPEDLDAVAALNTTTFKGPEEAAIIRRLHADNDTLLSLVVHRQDEIVGHVEFFRILIDGRPCCFQSIYYSMSISGLQSS